MLSPRVIPVHTGRCAHTRRCAHSQCTHAFAQKQLHHQEQDKPCVGWLQPGAAALGPESTCQAGRAQAPARLAQQASFRHCRPAEPHTLRLQCWHSLACFAVGALALAWRPDACGGVVNVAGCLERVACVRHSNTTACQDVESHLCSSTVGGRRLFESQSCVT
jgi:hypothetical protein